MLLLNNIILMLCYYEIRVNINMKFDKLLLWNLMESLLFVCNFSFNFNFNKREWEWNSMKWIPWNEFHEYIFSLELKWFFVSSTKTSFYHSKLQINSFLLKWFFFLIKKTKNILSSLNIEMLLLVFLKIVLYLIVSKVIWCNIMVMNKVCDIKSHLIYYVIYFDLCFACFESDIFNFYLINLILSLFIFHHLHFGL